MLLRFDVYKGFSKDVNCFLNQIIHFYNQSL